MTILLLLTPSMGNTINSDKECIDMRSILSDKYSLPRTYMCRRCRCRRFYRCTWSCRNWDILCRNNWIRSFYILSWLLQEPLVYFLCYCSYTVSGYLKGRWGKLLIDLRQLHLWCWSPILKAIWFASILWPNSWYTQWGQSSSSWLNCLSRNRNILMFWT